MQTPWLPFGGGGRRGLVSVMRLAQAVTDAAEHHKFRWTSSCWDMNW